MNGLGPVNGGPASGEFASSTVLTPRKGLPRSVSAATGAGPVQRTRSQFPGPLSGERNFPRHLRGYGADFTDHQRRHHQGIDAACELELSLQRGDAGNAEEDAREHANFRNRPVVVFSAFFSAFSASLR